MQMFNMTTIMRVVSRKVVCQVSEFILVMIKTATNSVAITVKDPISLTFSLNLWPYNTLRITKIALGILEDIAEIK